MSRNSNRLQGSHEPHDSTPVLSNNDYRLPQPTVMVDLPSEGKYYPPGHPLHNQPYVEIREMTTKDEEILANEDLVKRGLALDKMIQGLFVDKSIKLDTLLIGDKNAVVVAARKVNYKPEYRTSVICPVCSQPKEEVFDLNEVGKKVEIDEELLNEEEQVYIDENGTFQLEVQLTNDGTPTIIQLQLLTGVDEAALRLSKEKKKQHNLPEAPIREMFKRMIVSVDGSRDPRDISKFIDNLPRRVSAYIRSEYERVAPNINLKRPFQCERCSAESVIRIPFTARFFWTD